MRRPRSGTDTPPVPSPRVPTSASSVVESNRPSAWKRWRSGILGAGFAIYPILVWVGLSAWPPRTVALVLIAALVPLVIAGHRSDASRGIVGLAAVPLVTAAALALAACLDDEGLVLVVPVVINVLLLVTFGATLRSGARPMIERFARLVEPDLGTDKQAWCRAWTMIWCGFFVANGAVALGLSLAAPLSWWAIYNGLVAYALIGTLLAAEWILRRRRFGRGPTAAVTARDGNRRERSEP